MAPCSGLQMTVACGAEKIVFENIAFGNVYLAGGQSNMEFVMKSALPDESSLDESVFEKIRLFKLPPNTYYGPASAPEGNWIQADRESLSNFSAVGGFFAAALDVVELDSVVSRQRRKGL